MKISIPFLPTEIWQSIVVYLPSLRDFMRLWSNSQVLQSRYSKLDALFWDAILQAFTQASSLTSSTLALQMKVYACHTLKSLSCQSFKSIQHLFTRHLCTASGCLKAYEDWCNHARACSFHSGSLGQTNMLTCCRASSFQSPGCCSSFHRGDCHRMIFSSRSPEKLKSTKKRQQSRVVNDSINTSMMPAIVNNNFPAQSPANRLAAATTANVIVSSDRLPPIHTTTIQR